MTKMKTTISLNNSGGSDWLSDEDLQELRDRGWTLEFYSSTLSWRSKPYPHSVSIELPEREAVADFHEATGFTTNERGCDCCGCPFWVSEEEVEPKTLGEHLQEPSPLDDQAEAWLRLIGEPV